MFEGLEKNRPRLLSRRNFIIVSIAGGIGLAEYHYVNRYLQDIRDPQGRPHIRNYTEWGEEAAVKVITANEDFYVTSKGAAPVVDAKQWSLTIDGLVEKSLNLKLADVQALPSIRRPLTLECISNPVGGNYIGNAWWTGAALRPLIERGGIRKEAVYTILHGADGYSTGIPLERILREENFLAYEMNGVPLPRDHGYPLRIFIPGKYGMKQPKWLTRIEFVKETHLGYWERQGWSNDAERHIHSRIEDPVNHAELRGKEFLITGYALDALAGVKLVQLSFDDGKSWDTATLFSNPSPQTWAFWKYLWKPPHPGKYSIRLRATDNAGREQPRDGHDIFPDGATGQQVIHVSVV